MYDLSSWVLFLAHLSALQKHRPLFRGLGSAKAARQSMEVAGRSKGSPSWPGATTLPVCCSSGQYRNSLWVSLQRWWDWMSSKPSPEKTAGRASGFCLPTAAPQVEISPAEPCGCDSSVKHPCTTSHCGSQACPDDTWSPVTVPSSGWPIGANRKKHTCTH